jgi:hypothetical protein
MGTPRPEFAVVIAGHSRSKNGVLSHAYVPAIPIYLARPAFLSEMAGTSPAMTKGCGWGAYPVGFRRAPKRDSVTTVPINTKSSSNFEYSITRASMACSSVLIRVPVVHAAQDIRSTSGQM